MAMTMGMAFLAGHAAAQDAEVIYGNDDRRDVYDQGNSGDMVELARSTAALVRVGSLTPDSAKPGFQRLPSGTFASSFNLCAEERFREQPNPAFCSGFLVAENIFVTAGHCVETQTECSSTAFVFGFSYESEGQDVTSIPDENVYRCKRLIAQTLNGTNQSDYAVIELDRNVTGRTPLKFRSSGKPEVGNPLTVIGHPSGLPTKIAGGATVRSNDRSAYFVANLDTYGGNSGSAVFNTATGEVEGILVRGENDFITRGSCRVSNQCTDTGCRGEDVTRATEFAPHVPDPNAPSRPTQNHSAEAPNLGLAIPDNDATGITVDLNIAEAGTLADIGLHVTLEHSYVGDLKIVLIHPDGTEAVVVDGAGGGNDNIDTTFGLDGQSVADFASLKGKSSAGTWKVRITDMASSDVGTLQYVKLTTQVFIEE
jgi:subtilisin-like proprotein convertase family protein